MHKENWLEWRSQGIGASDAPIITGVAPRHWKINSPFKLWQLKLGLVENEVTTAMQRGLAYEEEALGWFQKQIGKCLFSQQCFEHPEMNWMRATFDGIDLDEEISVEIKVSSKDAFERVKEGKILPIYHPQLLHQMHVKPTKHHFLCVYLPDYKEGAFVEVEKNEVYLNEILEKEQEFLKCWKNQSPPELSEYDFIDRTIDEKWIRQARVVAELKQQLRELEKQEKQALNELIDLSEGQSCVGENFKLTKYFRKGSVDYSRIPELEKVDLEQYRKAPSMSFRFS